jgi:hypothetical protein
MCFDATPENRQNEKNNSWKKKLKEIFFENKSMLCV